LTFSEESVDVVKAWLASVGVSADRIRQSHGLSWLHFNASAGEAESLLRAKYHFWEHDQTGKTHVACDEYSLPLDIREHVDFILPSVHFDSRIGPRSGGRDRLKAREADRVRIGDPQSDGWLPKAGQWTDKSDLHHELAGCDQQTTPECLRALYGIPVNEEAVEGNSFGVAEFTPQAYVPTDLDIFFSNFSDKLVGERPILKTAQGAIVQQQNKSCSFNCESNLDLQYAMTLVYPQQVTLYQVGDVIGGASFNNFLDAFDATYCDGDDPAADVVYPNPTPGGYKGLKTCGTYDAAKVVTISYAYNEHDLMPAYEQRQCNEYLKLGLMGTSFLVSSGDNGVAGNGDQCIDPSDRRPGANATYTDGSSGLFNPMFPAVCPYVTAVGATQVIGGTNIVRALASNEQPEETLAQVAFSGGGFSNVFAMPNYQAETVHEWFKKHPPIYGSDRFNNSQRTRGFPDISANGANYAFAVNAEWSLTYGTSASAPVLGSILTLINQERLKAGKSSIGFINPTAYAHPEVFTDVTTGNNGGCGVDGWFAVPGWDPVTGLGTPNYPKMLELWMSLP
jgi:tripeptidyl-peptidase-1